MKRRDLAFILLGGAALWPLRIHAQRTANRIPRIGVLLPGTPASFSIRTKAFLDALSKLGRVEGGTVEMEWKWANDRVDVLPELADIALMATAPVNYRSSAAFDLKSLCEPCRA